MIDSQIEKVCLHPWDRANLPYFILNAWLTARFRDFSIRFLQEQYPNNLLSELDKEVRSLGCLVGDYLVKDYSERESYISGLLSAAKTARSGNAPITTDTAIPTSGWASACQLTSPTQRREVVDFIA